MAWLTFGGRDAVKNSKPARVLADSELNSSCT
jgi:hypothetical protein